MNDYELDDFHDNCWNCGGEGYFDAYEQDALWYEPGNLIACNECDGRGVLCISQTSAPLPLRGEPS
jgi:hypothetical protein